MTPVAVSVLIPARNAARFLAGTIESVRRQQVRNLEIVIVNDGSTDGTAAVAESLGRDIRCITQPHSGVASARNAALEVSRGACVAYLDADDEWTDGSLAAQLSRLESDPELDIVVGLTQAVRSESGPLAEGVPNGPPWRGPMLGSALIRRRAFERTGGFDPALNVAEDLDWFIRVREHGLVTDVLDRVTLLYRLHADSLTRGLDPVRRNLMVVLKRSLDRRRLTQDAAHAGSGA